jgi:hypothetical protein
MEFTTLGRALPRPRTNPAGLQVPFCVLIPVCVCISIMMLMAACITLAKGEVLPSPLLAWADILPGQPRSAIAGHEFLCAPSPPNCPDTCVYLPASGPFFQISVVRGCEEIEAVWFIVRDHALTVGELARMWGRPEIQEIGRFTTIAWPERSARALIRAPSHRLNYWLPIAYIYLTLPE